MQTQPVYPFVTPVIEVMARWWRNWKDAWRASGLDAVDQQEVAHMARDMGVSPAALRDLDRKGPGSAALLPKMMAALHVEAPGHSDVLRDLQQVCTMCDSKGRCVHELADGTAPAHYQDFCPNAHTLAALQQPVSVKI